MKEYINSLLLNLGAVQVGFLPYSAAQNNLLDCSAKSRIPSGAKTVIIAVFPYKVKDEPPKNICRYSAVPDYHIVCGDILKTAVEQLRENYKDHSFEAFIDNSPVPEVSAACAAGLGVKGKNGLFIHKTYGSYCFLGEIITTLSIPCIAKPIKSCINCGACEKACSVNLDKEKCLSKLSQQKYLMGEDLALFEKNARLVWGCDVCMEACPMNKNAKKTKIPAFINGYKDEYSFGEDIKLRAYAWRGEAVIKRNFELLSKKGL